MNTLSKIFYLFIGLVAFMLGSLYYENTTKQTKVEGETIQYQTQYHTY